MCKGRIEGFTDKIFGGAVVRGGIEGANAKGEGAVDDAGSGEGVGVRVVLVVEGCGAED